MLLVIDNYDSFTFNLVHYLAELGADAEVVRNDALSAGQILARKPSAVILSPGPCTPNEAGVCLALLAAAPAALPVLGVCLGHQAMGQAFGGEVVQARSIVHGKTSPVHHNGTGLFEGLPSPVEVTRYHSLAVRRETLPDCFLIDAWTQDGEIMALRHRARPLFGVQFHPESIASAHGKAMLRRFLDLSGAA